MKKIFTKTNLALALAVVMALGIATRVFASSNTYATPTFSDVPKSYWGYTYIERVAEKGWIKGMGDGTFAPDAEVTYAQFCTMLINSFFPKYLGEYDGGKDPWYLPYCLTAANWGLLNNTGVKNDITYKSADPNAASRPVRRGDMATMIYNALCSMDADMPSAAEIEAAGKKTPDVKEGSDNYFDIWAVKATGILSGIDSQGNFAPESSMTRAQAAVVLTKIEDLRVKQGLSTDINPYDPNNPQYPDRPGNTGDTSDTGSTGTNPSDGGRDANGYTLASSVNSAKPNVGKSDDYKTKGRAATPNKNGYYTAANVDIGDARLAYELLPMVNEARAKEGLAPVQWTYLDSAEEYTLLRAYEMDSHDKLTHARPNGQYNFLTEIAASGRWSYSVDDIFNGWMNSPGHRKAIMRENPVSMCAAQCNGYWIITFLGTGGPGLIENGTEVDYTENNDWYEGDFLN